MHDNRYVERAVKFYQSRVMTYLQSGAARCPGGPGFRLRWGFQHAVGMCGTFRVLIWCFDVLVYFPFGWLSKRDSWPGPIRDLHEERMAGWLSVGQ
jgi:hypothetical protein